MGLTDTSTILGIHATPFIMTKTLHKGFQIIVEIDSIILKKNTKTKFKKKMEDTGCNGFLLTTKIFINTININF